MANMFMIADISKSFSSFLPTSSYYIVKWSFQLNGSRYFKYSHNCKYTAECSSIIVLLVIEKKAKEWKRVETLTGNMGPL